MLLVVRIQSSPPHLMCLVTQAPPLCKSVVSFVDNGIYFSASGDEREKTKMLFDYVTVGLKRNWKRRTEFAKLLVTPAN